MSNHRRLRGASALAAALLAAAVSAPSFSQEPWRSPDESAGYGQSAPPSYGRGDSYAPQGGGGYAPARDGSSANDGYGSGGDAYSPSRNGTSAGGDAYSPPRDSYGSGGDTYSPMRDRQRNYTDPGRPAADSGGGEGYGEPYAPPPPGEQAGSPPPPPSSGTYEQGEIISAGHQFFGAISQNLAEAVEYAFKSQGRPNGYILGEDAGGAFVVGLRYGEGRLYTKDAGDHKVFWQGPSLGYDAGAEGSKAMVLVYNLHDPSEIYNRFGGVQGSAYLVGGLSVQFQKYGDVTLAVIRSGVGLRLGANVGYLKYTRAPTWNPL
jgi:hypothetical protein